MNSVRSQRGFVSISGIFWLIVLACIIFVSVRVVPPYVNNYQFQDSINTLVLNSSYTPVSEDEIFRTVMLRARDCGIELQPKQVSVHKQTGTVTISASYDVPVDLIVRQVDLHFEPTASNQNILMK